MEYDRNDSREDEPWKAEAIGRESFSLDNDGAETENDGRPVPPSGFYRPKHMRQSNAQEAGRKAEESARGVVSSGGSADARQAEAEGGKMDNRIDYTGSGGAESSSGGGKGGGFLNFAKGRLKGKKSGLTKYGAVAFLAIALLVIGVITAISTWLAPFGFIANVKNVSNVMRTAMNLASNPMLSEMLSQGGSGSGMAVVGSGASGAIYEGNLGVTEEMEESMKGHDIYLVCGGHALAFHDTLNNVWSLVTSNDGGGGCGSAEIEGVGSVSFSDTSTLDEKYQSSGEFSAALDASLRLWKGHIAGWFDESGKYYNEQIENNRNKLRDTGKAKASIDDLKNAKDNYGAKEEIKGSKNGQEVIFCAIGIPWTDICLIRDNSETEKLEEDGLTKDLGEDAVMERIINRAKKVAYSYDNDRKEDKPTKKCAAQKIAATIDAVGSAVTKLKVENMASEIFESVDKAKVTGDAGAMLAYWGEFAQPGNTEVINEQGNTTLAKENTTTMESIAYNEFWGDTATLLRNNPIAKMWSANWVVDETTSSLGGTAIGSQIKDMREGEETCSAVTTYSNVDDFMDEQGMKVTGGLVGGLDGWTQKLTFQKDWIGEVMEALGVGSGGGQTERDDVIQWSQEIASATKKRMTEMLKYEAHDHLRGETIAGLMHAGATSYVDQKLQFASGRNGTEELLMAQWKETQEVIAREAEVDRLLHSPFDVTNENTFLGSIVFSMMPMVNKLSQPLSVLSNFANTALASFRSIIPIAGAASEENGFKEQLNDDCPTIGYLEVESGKMVGSAECLAKSYMNNKVFKEKKPSEIYKEINTTGITEAFSGVQNFNGVDDKGNPKINPNGELALWLTCGTRKSQLGFYNGQIATETNEKIKQAQSGSDVKSTVQEGINKKSAEEIDLSIYDKVYAKEQINWGTGLNCNGGENNSAIQERIEYYGAFMITQMLLEVAGAIDTNTQVAYLREKDAAKPVDDSLEGIIAEYSGLDKEEVLDVFAFLDYYDYVAHYDPVGLRPVLFLVEEEVFFEDDSVIAEIMPAAVVAREVEYADLRQQTITA